MNVKMFAEEPPRVMFRAECGRILSSEKLTYCEKCMEVYSNTRCRKDPAILFDPLKVETIMSGPKFNHGKNANEKVCPICMLILKDVDFKVEQKAFHYLQCKYCLWNTLNHNFIHDSGTLYKFANSLYKRHKQERENELNTAVDYIRQKFNLSNKVLALKEQKAERAQGRATYNVLGAESKTKQVWTTAKLYALLENLQKSSLGEEAVQRDSSKLNSHSRLFPRDSTESESKQKSDVDEDKDEKSDCKSKSSDSDSSDAEKDETAETSKPESRAESGLSPTKLGSGAVSLSAADAEVEGFVSKVFVDNPFLFSSEKSTDFDSIDDFIANSKSQNINSNIFEQSPTKVFRGPESYISIHSVLIPQNNKFCPKPDCKNGLVYYDKGSDSFAIKYSTEFSKYFPTLKMHSTEANIPSGFNTITLSMRNKTKYSQKLLFKVPESKLSAYRFKDGEKEYEYLLSASENDGGKMVTNLTLEVAKHHHEDVTLQVEVNLIMEGAEALTVKTEMILQFGDEEDIKRILDKYK